jgi:hypothetical protein
LLASALTGVRVGVSEVVCARGGALEEVSIPACVVESW